jgi:hypothetical protein
MMKISALHIVGITLRVYHDWRWVILLLRGGF